jgi:D-alanyl-D-alanine carboxypeptidase
VTGVLLTACASDNGSSRTVTTAAVASTPTVAGLPRVTLDLATTAELQSALELAFARSGLPGVAAAIWIGDQHWTSSLGVSDLTTKAPFRPDDNMRVASITKTFTATAVLQLVKNGKLSLDDKLDQYIPGLPNGAEITIRHLLGMQSGLFDYAADEGFVQAFDADPTMTFRPQQVIDIVKAHGPKFPPGTKTDYTDTNFVLLGLIIEKVTGRAAQDVITTDVIAPLGLTHTMFPTDSTMPRPHPTSYAPSLSAPGTALRVVNDVNPTVTWTAGAMVSRLEDLRVWARELTDGSLLTPQLQKERVQARRFDNMPFNLGYGLGVTVLNDLVGHGGAIYGYSSIVFRLPQVDATFVVIGNASTNSSHFTFDIVLSLIGRLYPDEIH